MTSAIRRSANGEACTMRLPGICNYDATTTVWCHIRRPWNAGTGMKPPDIHGFYACSACHDAIDGRTKSYILDDPTAWAQYVIDAHLRSLDRLKVLGILEVRR